jgi:hypothetical protein
MTTLLIRNAAAILTGLCGAQARHGGPDLRVSDGVIDALGSFEAKPGEAVLDATDCVVYPAWINTHHHLFHSLMKGDPQGIDLPLTGWLAATPYRLRPAFDEALFRLSARIGMIELARSKAVRMRQPWRMSFAGAPPQVQRSSGSTMSDGSSRDARPTSPSTVSTIRVTSDCTIPPSAPLRPGAGRTCAHSSWAAR